MTSAIIRNITNPRKASMDAMRSLGVASGDGVSMGYSDSCFYGSANSPVSFHSASLDTPW